MELIVPWRCKFHQSNKRIHLGLQTYHFYPIIKLSTFKQFNSKVSLLKNFYSTESHFNFLTILHSITEQYLQVCQLNTIYLVTFNMYISKQKTNTDQYPLDFKSYTGIFYRSFFSQNCIRQNPNHFIYVASQNVCSEFYLKLFQGRWYIFIILRIIRTNILIFFFFVLITVFRSASFPSSLVWSEVNMTTLFSKFSIIKAYKYGVLNGKRTLYSND